MSRIPPLRLFEVLTRNRQSALEFVYCLGAAENGHLHILEYLVERKYDQYYEFAQVLPFGHLDCLKYLYETAKAPGIRHCSFGAQMVIFIYSNILSSVNMMNMTKVRVRMQPIRPLRLFEVLTRNRQSALGFYTASGALKMVIFTYSNILLSVSIINMSNLRQYAAKFGHLDCLKYLHKTARAPLDYLAYEKHKNNQTECLRYLPDNYGPYHSWRYEHGELCVPESEVFSSSESESE